jgi:hypothetical protein
MFVPDFEFPKGCILNCDRRTFLAVAAEAKLLPSEQCAHREGCIVVDLCKAEGQKHEDAFKNYEKPSEVRGCVKPC